MAALQGGQVEAGGPVGEQRICLAEFRLIVLCFLKILDNYALGHGRIGFSPDSGRNIVVSLLK